MQDVKWITTKGWEISGVFKKLPSTWNEYLIKLRKQKEDSFLSEYEEVKIQGSKIYDELVELKSGKRERCYFAYGMADIDVYKLDEDYVIMNSPNEGLYKQFVIEPEEFNRLLNCLNESE